MMRQQISTSLAAAHRSTIREFAALARTTPGCISLTLGEPDFDTPQPVCQAVGEALAHHETHYIQNSGSPELRQAIANFEHEKNGMDYTPEEIIVTAGASEALFAALFGILNPGDEVIIPSPAFLLYKEIVGLCRGTPVFLDTTEDHFQINPDKLTSLVGEKTKAIILNTPNNPTGCIYTPESLQAVYRAVKGKPVFVICDDVYRQLIYTPDYHSMAEFRDLREQLLVVQSFSKPYAMTGWRVGYLMADRSITERLELVHQFMVVSVPSLFQRACIAALKCDPAPMVEVYRKRRAYVLERLEKMGMEVHEPLGAFYVFPSIAPYGLDSGEFCTRMIHQAGLAATPGFCFGSDRHIRLTYCYSDEVLQEGMNRLERFIRSL